MNDLTTPLGIKTPGGRRLRLPLGVVAVGFGVACVAGLALWMILVNDPNGGEPYASAQIEAQSIGIDRGDITTVGVKSGAGALLAPVGANASPSQPQPVVPGDVAVTIHKPDASEPSVVRPSTIRLAIGADPSLIETGPWGQIPRVSEDGRRPLDAYARPVPASVGAAPKIALIVSDLGLSQTTTQSAIAELPAEVTLAFAPYGASLDRWVGKARQEGHEILLQIPLEPFDYPDNDPGPDTLLTGNDAAKNLASLHTLMARLNSYVGLVNYMGGKFTADAAAFEPLLTETTQRGLMYVDDGTSARSLAASLAGKAKTPFAKADVAFEPNDGPSDMAGRFSQLEQIARSRGVSVGISGARPTTVAAIVAWAKELDSRGIILVPISSALRKDE